MLKRTLILTAVVLSIGLLFAPMADAKMRARPMHPGWYWLTRSSTPLRVRAVSLRPRLPLATPAKWRTAGGQYPDATDPTRLLPASLQRSFQCIRFYESRNHLVDGAGSKGWYQFTDAIWSASIVRAALPGLPANANRATGDQQSAVAVFYWHRNGRLGVEWAAEAGECPGRFR